MKNQDRLGKYFSERFSTSETSCPASTESPKNSNERENSCLSSDDDKLRTKRMKNRPKYIFDDSEP